MPSPQSSTPQLFDTIRSSLVPASWRALMSSVGTPQSPNPPTAIEAPSGMSATASAAEGTTLSKRGSLSSWSADRADSSGARSRADVLAGASGGDARLRLRRGRRAGDRHGHDLRAVGPDHDHQRAPERRIDG